MDDIKDRLKEGEKLFEEGKYSEAVRIGMDLANEQKAEAQAYLLAAKSTLFTVPSVLSDNAEAGIELSARIAARAVECAQSLSEGYDIVYQLKCVWNQWEAMAKRFDCANLMGRVNEDTWNDYMKSSLAYAKQALLFTAITGMAQNSEKWTVLLEKEGLTKEEAKEKYGKEAPEIPLDKKEIRNSLNEIAWSAFERAVDVFNENSRGSTYAEQILLRTIKPRFVTVYEMLIYLCNIDKEEQTPDETVEYLRHKAGFLEFNLNAVMYPSGVPVSLIGGSGRANYIAELRDTYAEIKKIDPSVESPPLPSMTYFEVPQQTGGCYVATAVYGNYDCPQVWTLRRYRDDTLAKTWCGRVFIRGYYKISPTLVKWFGDKTWFQRLWRHFLDRKVETLNKAGVDNTPYKDKTW